MPWRGPSFVGEQPSLGEQVGEWIEAHCVIPDEEFQGHPYKLTEEMWTFLLHHYRLKPDASPDRPRSAWFYRRSQLVRPQKWGKGPFSAALICAEAVGPTFFAGWDANGEPVGKPWATPLIQVTAASEEQAGNVYDALLPMIQESETLSQMIPDAGQTRINIPGGGKIEPVTAAARSRLGQRVTFVVQDETGTWTESNGGQSLADTQRRGLAGMGGRAIETTNAWDPSENSVAQKTFESSAKDVYRDFRQAPAALNYGLKSERRKIHKHVYGDAWWVDLDRIESEAAELLERDPSQAERFFGNRVVYGAGSWLDHDAIPEDASPLPPDGTSVAGGFDGSEHDDWTAIKLETRDGLLFTPRYGPDQRLAYWNPEEWGGRIPREEVLAAWDEISRRYDIVRAYCDPGFHDERSWESDIETWDQSYGPGRFIPWPTNQIRRMYGALTRFKADIRNGDIRFDDCQQTRVHLRNCKMLAKPGDRYILGKPSQKQKIDLAMTSVLAHEAAADARAAGWPEKTEEYAYFT